MPFFRFHNGSFSESLKTEVEIKNIVDLLELLNENILCLDNKISIDQIEINKYFYDKRLKKDLFIVKINNYKNESNVIGFIDCHIK